MAETNAGTATSTEQQGGGAAASVTPTKVGKVVAVKNQAQHQKQEPPSGGAGAGASSNSGAAGANEGGAGANEGGKGAAGGAGSTGSTGAAGAAGAATEPIKLTEDQIKEYFKEQGIEYTSLEDAKAKLSKKEETVLSAEDKAKLENQREQRRVQIFLEGGGTAEQYASIKRVAGMDLKELSQKEAVRELVEANFTEDQAKEIIKERYFQFEEDDLERLPDETQKEYAKRQRDFFTAKLAGKAKHLQENAKNALSELDEHIDSEEREKKSEEEMASKVDAHFSKLSRTLSIDLGKVDDQEIAPITYNVTDEEINEVKETLKNPELRKKLLFTEDGSLNIELIGDALIKSKIFSSAIKVAALEGGNREVEKAEKLFPSRKPHEVGVGGAGATGNAGSSGKVKSFGSVVSTSGGATHRRTSSK